MKNNFDSDLDLHGSHDDGEIWVNEFSEESVKAFRRKVTRQAANGPDVPIVIYIDSYGGAADSLMAMIDIMESVPNPFITAAVGKACSSGAILLSSGDYRYCSRNARIMIHRVSAGTFGNIREIITNFKEIERIDAIVMDMLARNCGMNSRHDIYNILKQRDLDDLWMSAEEAKMFGLVDFIGMPNVAPMIRWSCAVMPERLIERKPNPQTATDNNKKRKAQKTSSPPQSKSKRKAR